MIEPGSREEAQAFAAECAEHLYKHPGDWFPCVECGEEVVMANVRVTPWGLMCSEDCEVRAYRSFDNLPVSPRMT